MTRGSRTVLTAALVALVGAGLASGCDVKAAKLKKCTEQCDKAKTDGVAQCKAGGQPNCDTTAEQVYGLCTAACKTAVESQ